MNRCVVHVLLLVFAALPFCAPTPASDAGEKATPKAGSSAVETGKILKRTYFFKEAGKDMEYALFVPQGYDTKKPTPLVVALHGLYATPQMMIRYPKLTELAQKYGLMVVAPMGYNTQGWYGNKGWKNKNWQPENLGELSEKDVLNVLNLIRKEFNVDANRIYLMGHSMGGGGTLYLAMKYPDLWAALAPIAPAIFRGPAEIHKIKHIPVILVQGEQDKLVPVSISRRWAAAMKDHGMTYQYIEVKGGDHIFPAFQKLPDIFEFMSKQRKKS
jgi:predicted peptidase